MPFFVEKVSCVAVGTFNIYILQPNWLAGIGASPEEVEVRFETDLSRPGFKFSLEEYTWLIRPDRLLVESQSLESDCGGKVATVLRELPHTPLQAIGNNIFIRGTVDDLSELVVPGGFPSLDLNAAGIVKQRTWHVGLERDNSIFNVQLAAVDPDGVATLNVNVHTEARRAPGGAEAAARLFQTHVRQSIELASQLLDLRIET